MFNREAVVEKIESIIGYSSSTQYGVSNPDILASDSLRQIDRKNPLTNHKNLFATYPKDQDYASYEDYLESIRRESILEAIQSLFQYKQLNTLSKSLLTDVSGIYGEKLSIDSPSVPGSNFVGYRVRSRERGYRMMRLTRLGLSLTNAQTLDIYVFKTPYSFDPSDAYASRTVNYTKGGNFEWVDIEDVIMSFSDDNDEYYIGYYEDDIAGNSYMTRSYDFSRPVCGSCNQQDKLKYKTWSPYLNFFPVSVDPDTYEVEATNKVTYGLNFSFSVECDVTPILLRNTDQIATLAVEMAVIRHLKEIYHSTEINKEADRLKANAHFALYGEWTTSGTQPLNKGLLKEFEKTLEATSFELSGLGDKCLGCNKHGILKWR